MTKPFWEQTYADPTADTFGQPSEEIRQMVDLLPPKARVLDLGCGEGRNAIFLAKNGFDVTAIDISTAGIQKLRRLAAEAEVPIYSEIADMREFVFTAYYDLIISHGCLHLVERPDWLGLIRKFKHYTKPGGINVTVVFTDLLPPPNDLKDVCIGLFREGELAQLYSDWETILSRSYTFEDKHPGDITHIHPANKVVMRKPSNHCVNPTR